LVVLAQNLNKLFLTNFLMEVMLLVNVPALTLFAIIVIVVANAVIPVIQLVLVVNM